MIIIGTYVNRFRSEDKLFKILDLNELLLQIIPKGLGVHILPIYESSGDYGFAVDDCMKIDEDIGTWDNVDQIAVNYKLILDGIYNHVSLNHPWYKGLLSGESRFKDYFHIFKDVSVEDGPKSSRGIPVLHEIEKNTFIWHSFTKYAADVNLSNLDVLKAIDKHLKKLHHHKVYGVRLDAIAYYGKELRKPLRHHASAFSIAQNIYSLVVSNKLKTIAQLDCDERGIKYFKEEKASKDVLLNDFSFPVHLGLSILKGTNYNFKKHIELTESYKRPIIRVPRTHDGILLRSTSINEKDKSLIVERAKNYNLKIRYGNKSVYEINCSGPFFYSMLTDIASNEKIQLFVIGISCAAPGWTYLYLPFLMNFIPESIPKSENEDSDPRGLNRTIIPESFINEYIKSNYFKKVYELLSLFSKILMETDGFHLSNFINDESSIIFESNCKSYIFYANIGKSNNLSWHGLFSNYELIYSTSNFSKSLSPLSFIILHKI